ncbi:hypothetical protein APHAL10511_007960 [Amanita phalloides]|nr:hypothetical protein APHAL10511_007960 [Amanita phalloides]
MPALQRGEAKDVPGRPRHRTQRRQYILESFATPRTLHSASQSGILGVDYVVVASDVQRVAALATVHVWDVELLIAFSPLTSLLRPSNAMGSLCFSSVPILRCDLLSLSQNIALVIPVALEALSTTILFLKLWSRRQLLLTCESWIYLLLTIVELISQLYPPMRQGLNTFRNFDTVIGMMSFIPILLYSSFLCGLIIFEFMDLLSARLRTIVIPCLIFFVPFLVGMNQAASFVGISYVFSPPQGPMIVFEDSRSRYTWTLFTSMTLGFFTSFQMTVWCFVAFRFAQVLLEQRRLNYRPGAGFSRIGGVGWIIIGIKLAATETMMGFAGSGFKIILIRRIMRCVSRTLLCMGLLVGPTPHRNASRRRKPRLEPTFHQPEVIKTYVSNTRLNAFHHLSPAATTFLENRRWSQPGTFPLAAFKNLSSDDHRRATIHFDNGTPKLQLRLSDIDLLDPMTLAKSRTTSWQSDLPHTRDKPFTVQEYRSSLDLGDVEIVSVPRTTYVPEKAKPTLLRTASGRTVVRPAPGYVTNPFESSQNDEGKREHLIHPIGSVTSSSVEKLSPLLVPLSDVTQSETRMISSSAQYWSAPAPPPAAHAKMYSSDRSRGVPASASAPEIGQVDSLCADLLQGATCRSTWSLDTSTSESLMVSGAPAGEGNSVYQSAQASFQRSTFSLCEPLRKSSQSSLWIHREPDQFEKFDSPPQPELLCDPIRDDIVPAPSRPHTPLVVADDFEAASVPPHAEQRSITHDASSWSFDTATSHSSMVFRAPTDENVPAHEGTREGARRTGQRYTRLLHVPREGSTRNSLWIHSEPELSRKLELPQPKHLYKAVQDGVVPTLPPSPLEEDSIYTPPDPSHAELKRNSSSLSLDTATSESSMVFRAPTDESVPAYNSIREGGQGAEGRSTSCLHTPRKESNHSRPCWIHREPNLFQKLEPPPHPELPCDPVQDGVVRMQTPPSPVAVEGFETVSVLSQLESLPARPESEVVDGSVPWAVPAPGLPAVLENPQLETRSIKTDDARQPKRIIVHVTQSSIDDRL